MFSNPAGNARDAAATYTANLLALLGNLDPLLILAETPEWLEGAIRGVPEERLRRPEAPGKWSALSVLQHLADSEMVYGYRIRLIVAQDEPEIAGYDQDLWARRLRYDEDDPQRVLLELRVMRERNLRFLGFLSPEDRQRAGEHSERGRETVEHIVRLLGAHDLVHRRQIRRILGS